MSGYNVRVRRLFLFALAVAAIATAAAFSPESALATSIRNPKIGIDVDARLINAESIDYLAEFGYGYIRMQVYAEDLVSSDPTNLELLAEVKRRCDLRRLELWLVVESKTMETALLRDALEQIAKLDCGLPRTIQILDDINLKNRVPADRYEGILKVAKLALALPKGHYLAAGGIKGADGDYLQKLASTRALEHADIVTVNVFPPLDGIENSSDTRVSPRMDLPAAASFVELAASFGKPVWIGETGMPNSLTGYGVDEFTQAGNVPRIALLLLSMRAEKVTIFTAFDPPESEKTGADGKVVLNFGMIPADLRPRAWAWTIRNLNIFTAELVPSWHTPIANWSPSFPATSDPIYSVWYESANHVAVLFWTDVPSPLSKKTGLIVYNEDISPAICQNLQEQKPWQPRSNYAKNMIVTGGLPLSSIPTILIFNRHS